MKKILLLLALMPFVAVADPSISTDSSRELDTSTTKSIKRDKSLSKDKSSGNRESWSDSNEHARELSVGRNHSEKTGRSWDTTGKGSISLKVNSILLREFVRGYERSQPGPDSPRVQRVFNDCKPLTGIVNEYPTLNSVPARSQHGMYFDPNDIVPRRMARHFEQGAGSSTGIRQGISLPSSEYHLSTDQSKFGVQTNYDMPASNREVGRYGKCRILASWWVKEAGVRAATTTARSEEEVTDLIRNAYKKMNDDPQLFDQMVINAQQLWNSADCSATLKRWADFQKPELICQGVIVVDGNSIEVENQQTLSEQSIAGRSFEIALESSDSQNVAIDDTDSTDARESVAARESDQRERYREAKKTASMSKSKSLDRSESGKTSRKSGANLSSTPVKD